MRGGRGCTIGIVSAVFLLFVGLYLTMEAWAMEKAQAEGQLVLARAEASKLVSTLESKLRDSAGQHSQLQDQLVELRAQLSGKDTELAEAKAQLQARASEAASEKAKLLSDIGAAESKLATASTDAAGAQSKLSTALREAEEKLSAQTAEASNLRGLLKKAEERAAAAAGKSSAKKEFSVEVDEVAWKDMDKVPVWVWWDFPRGVPTGYRLNVRTWMRHIPVDKFDLRLVNFSNIKKYIPDLPDAFFRMYPLAQSDFVRAAMIALHGGVYMDGDMLLRNDLDEVFKEIFDGTTEVIPYLWEHQECRKSFSTNFMAGTKGNALSRGWLSRIYRLMSSKCPKKVQPGNDGMYEFYEHNGCCYTPSGEPRQKCYVTFGEFGDRSAHATMEELDRNTKKRRLRMSCISKWKGMAANASGSGGELLWKKLLPGPPDGYQGPIGPWSKVPKKDQREEMCWRDGKADLRCSQSGLYPVWFERHGYHEFNLNNNDLLSGFSKEEELLNSETVIAELYKLALEGEQPDSPDPRLAQIPMKPIKVNEQDKAKNKWWGDTQQYKLPWLRNKG